MNETENNKSSALTENLIKEIRFKNIESDPEKVYAQVQDRISNDRYNIAGPSKNKNYLWKVISIAASVALLMVSSWFVIYSNQDAPPLAYLEVSSVPGSKVRVVLPDNTVVWLNGNTSLRYPQSFTGKTRDIEFMGEGMFEVAKDANKPFIVTTNKMRIKVLGTKFNVYSSTEENIVETTLLEGSVALYAGSNNTKDANVILKPDEQAIYTPGTNQIEIRNVSATNYISWINNSFMFDNSPLDEIVRTLQHGFQTKIHLSDESLKKIRITGQFTHEETLDEILSIIQISAHYKYKKEKGEIYIYQK